MPRFALSLQDKFAPGDSIHENETPTIDCEQADETLSALNEFHDLASVFDWNISDKFKYIHQDMAAPSPKRWFYGSSPQARRADFERRHPDMEDLTLGDLHKYFKTFDDDDVTDKERKPHASSYKQDDDSQLDQNSATETETETSDYDESSYHNDETQGDSSPGWEGINQESSFHNDENQGDSSLKRKEQPLVLSNDSNDDHSISNLDHREQFRIHTKDCFFHRSNPSRPNEDNHVKSQ